YNNPRHLRPAVESILQQTYADFEFIIVNDGSSDNSQSILEGFAAKDLRIRLVSRPNTGYCRALNEALRYARGEFIGRMDADDIAVPDRFERQIAYLREHPECVAVGGRVLLMDDAGVPLCEMCQEQTHEEIDAAHLAGRGGTIAHPAMTARRSAMEAIGGYDESFDFAEDLDFFLRMAEYGRVANLECVVLRYRQHLASIGYTKSETQQRSALAVLRAAYKRRGLELPHAIEARPIETFSAAQVHRKWAWWALDAGNLHGARKHAWLAFLREPFRIDSWRAIFCALRGR
ncbi:MAG: glycosyltransferase, partial [Candidatus Hydrogenedentes bacterium]|nr:glycosyltransferase [Candidatus Hydrogenedentota bacterium]